MSKWSSAPAVYNRANNSLTLASITYDEGGVTANLVAADVGRAVIFQDAATNTYWATVQKVVGLTAWLGTIGHLPAGDIAAVPFTLILSNASTHSYASYIAQIKVLVQDNAARLTDAALASLLTSAVTDYGEDKPVWIAVRVAGTGSQSYNLTSALGALWKWGYTVLGTLEYPAGQIPPQMVENVNWDIYDDGTAQDGSNIVLRFTEATPAVGEYFVLRVRNMLQLPEVGTQNFPDNDSNFSNICLLASAYYCWAVAASYATTRSSTIVGDAINYGDFTERYLKLAREFLKRYNQTVFGGEEPQKTLVAADVLIKLEGRASDRGRLLFH